MSHRIASVLVVSALTACAARQPNLPPTADQRAELDAAYGCAVNALNTAGYATVKARDEFSVMGQIRTETTAAQQQQNGGMVGGADSKPRDVIAIPYELDAVDVKVSLDQHTRAVRVDATAYTGSGASSNSGFVKRGASVRGSNVIKAMQACTG